MTIDLEELAKVAQGYVSECPTIVLGTGATIPHGLPSMSNLALHLADLDVSISNDSERDTWSKFSSELLANQDLEQALHEIALSEPLLLQIVRATWKLINPQDQKIHGRILRSPGLLPLTRLFKHLMRTARREVYVITTNYDRLTEYAASSAGAAFFTGFGAGFFNRFYTTDSAHRDKVSFPGCNGHVTIWKVHGSLDWFLNETGDAVSIFGASEIPNGCQPLIVTPGLTKYRRVHQDPFRTILTRADSVLKQATGFLCIGFGFNDEHVQPILLDRNRRDKIPLIIVTKRLTNNARSLLSDEAVGLYLAFEEASQGTTVYTPNYPAGVLLEGRSLWQLEHFINLVLGKEKRRHANF